MLREQRVDERPRIGPCGDVAADEPRREALRCRSAHRQAGNLRFRRAIFRRGRGISVAGTPEHGAVVQQARDLVHHAHRHGYRTDELIQIIQDVA